MKSGGLEMSECENAARTSASLRTRQTASGAQPQRVGMLRGGRQSAAAIPSDAEAQTQVLKVATLRVGGMTCSACSSTVERALAAEPGVLEASVSCVTHRAQVTFDASQVPSAASFLETIEDVGFEATLLEETALKREAGGKDTSSSSSSWRAELQIEGMTCTACSGTIERHLNSVKGVERATVSLVLNRAFVTYDPSACSAEEIKEEIEDIGFDAKVTAAMPTEASTGLGHAKLHVFIILAQTPIASPLGSESSGPALLPPAIRGGWECDIDVSSITGVSGCQKADNGSWCIQYDPHVIGARALLQQLEDAAGPTYTVEWANTPVQNDQLQILREELSGLGLLLKQAVPPVGLMLLLTTLLPICGIDPSEQGFLSTKIVHSVNIFIITILLISTPVQFHIASRFHRAAFKAVKRQSPNMDVLVSIATNTSYFYSVALVLYCLTMPESDSTADLVMATRHFFTMGPMLIVVVLFGKSLEARAKLSAMKALTDLPSTMPKTATLCSSGSHPERTIPVELLELNDVLRVFAGGKVPVDGEICSQAAVHVDESLLTGESTPVLRQPGELLVGGATCLSGGCLMRVTRVGSDTMLGQMVALVQDAQASKAEVQRTADKVARIFVPSVVTLSFLTFLVWDVLVFSGVVHVPQGHSPHHRPVMDMTKHSELSSNAEVQDSLKLLFAMKFGMAVLMIACPCAMGLATPMAVLVSTGVAAKHGCLVKSAASIEIAAKLDAVVLDKTGTITQGAPTIKAAAIDSEALKAFLPIWKAYSREARKTTAAALQPRAPPPPELISPMGVSISLEEKAHMMALFWWLLGTLESSSDHPVAKCIFDTVNCLSGLPEIIPPTMFEYFSGRGVLCTVSALHGVSARAGNMRFYEETLDQSKEEVQLGPCNAELRAWISTMQERGETVVLMHLDSTLVGAVSLSDPVRPDAAWVVDYLQNTLGLEVWLCTGDNAATAQSIANEVGIHHIVAEALPGAKSACVKQLQARGPTPRRVCFVGDGVNDSIALAQADVGVAIGVGAQIAVEAADVALVRSDLQDCVFFLSLSTWTFRTILLNFFWAFCFNFVCLPLAAGVFYPTVHIPPLAAGIGMASSSCLVVMTSFALSFFRAPTPASSPIKRQGRDHGCPNSGKSSFSQSKRQFTGTDCRSRIEKEPLKSGGCGGSESSPSAEVVGCNACCV